MFQKPRLSNAVSHRVFPTTEGHTHPVTCRTTGVYLKHMLFKTVYRQLTDHRFAEDSLSIFQIVSIRVLFVWTLVRDECQEVIVEIVFY